MKINGFKILGTLKNKLLKLLAVLFAETRSVGSLNNVGESKRLKTILRRGCQAQNSINCALLVY